jgi:hypothetical protein
MFGIEKAHAGIEERNRIRQEAQLPRIPVAAELCRLHELHRANEFDEFFHTSPIRKRVEEKLLAVARRMRNDPDWLPSGVLSGGRLGFYVWTRRCGFGGGSTVHRCDYRCFAIGALVLHHHFSTQNKILKKIQPAPTHQLPPITGLRKADSSYERTRTFGGGSGWRKIKK